MATAVSSIPQPISKARKSASSLLRSRATSKATKKGKLHELRGVSDEALQKHPVTSFQSRVYALTQAIPKGFVTTYGAMAHILNSSPRAVGQALRNNPFAPIVPCHRVISQTGLGGFFGQVDGEQLDRKVKLLKSEGVNLIDEGAAVGTNLKFSSAIIDASNILTAESFQSKMEASSQGFKFDSEAIADRPHPNSKSDLESKTAQLRSVIESGAAERL